MSLTELHASIEVTVQPRPKQLLSLSEAWQVAEFSHKGSSAELSVRTIPAKRIWVRPPNLLDDERLWPRRRLALIETANHHELPPHCSRGSPGAPRWPARPPPAQRLCRGRVGQGTCVPLALLSPGEQLSNAVNRSSSACRCPTRYAAPRAFHHTDDSSPLAIGPDTEAAREAKTVVADADCLFPHLVHHQVSRCRPGQHPRRVGRDGCSRQPRPVD